MGFNDWPIIKQGISQAICPFYFMFVWNFSALHLFTMLILVFLKIGNKHNLTTQCGDELSIKHNPHHITEALYGHQQ